MAEDVFGIVGGVIAATYHVESVVAEGGFGVVYRAHHGGLRAPVALKLLKVPQQAPQAQAAFLELLRAEAELLFRLSASSPNVARALHVAAFSSEDGRFVPYLVLEWLEGMTLGTLIAERRRAQLAPIPLRKLVRLLTPVARVLERAHNFSGPDGPVSIVHGDLKPENIFVAQVAGEELVKILDLGIGKLKSVASQIAGRMSPDGSAPMAFTPAYGAPEQWAPRQYGQTGPWTDVWGLALCMVEVMAARTLITGEPATMMGIALEPKRRPTPRNEGVDLPDALEAVFARALSLDPRARQRHAGVFWNELVAALDQPEPSANTRAFEIAEDLEFDPSSVRRLAAAPVRVSAPYSIPLSAPGRMPAASRPSAPAPAPASASASASAPAPMRTAAASAPHFVPDLELAPPSVSRRPSGQRPVAQPAPAQADLLELDSASVPAVLALDLDSAGGRTARAAQRQLPAPCGGSAEQSAARRLGLVRHVRVNDCRARAAAGLAHEWCDRHPQQLGPAAFSGRERLVRGRLCRQNRTQTARGAQPRTASSNSHRAIRGGDSGRDLRSDLCRSDRRGIGDRWPALEPTRRCPARPRGWTRSA